MSYTLESSHLPDYFCCLYPPHCNMSDSMASRTQHKRTGTHTGTASPPPKKTKTGTLAKSMPVNSKQEQSGHETDAKGKTGDGKTATSQQASRQKGASAADTSGESSDGVEIVENLSKATGKPSRKATVEEVDDEGDVSSSDSSGVQGARKGSEVKMDEDEHEQLGMCMFQCAEVGAEIACVPERMRKKWNSIMYAFYEEAEIKYKGDQRQHFFKCLKRRCLVHVNQFLDTKDTSSTSNLHRHVLDCWGPEVLKAVKEVGVRDEVCEKIVKLLLTLGTITAHFECKKGKITYSHWPHTHVETWTEIAKWVCKSV